MATHSETISLDNHNVDDTSLRALMTAWYACFEIGPVTQTSDTGQFDPTTITAASLSTTVGNSYRVHYLDDALHSTRPLYIRTGWHLSAAAGYIRNTVTVGTGTDGAGNITGLRATVTSTAPASQSAVADTGVLAGSAGEGYCFAFTDVAYTRSSTGYSVGVMRTVDEDENITGDGALIYLYKVGATGPAGQMASLDFAHTATVAASQNFAFMPNSNSSGLTWRTTSFNSSDKDFARVSYPLMNQLHTTPFLIASRHSDYSDWTTSRTATPVSVEHTYRPILSNVNFGYADYYSDAWLLRPMVVWE